MVVVVVGVGRHLVVGIGTRTMKVTKKLMMGINDNVEEFVMMVENTMILMKLDEEVLRGRRVLVRMMMTYRIVWGVVLARVRVLRLLMSIY